MIIEAAVDRWPSLEKSDDDKKVWAFDNSHLLGEAATHLLARPTAVSRIIEIQSGSALRIVSSLKTPSISPERCR